MYLNGKVNRRIDVLLDVLLKIEHDQFFQYELKHRLLQPNKQTFKIEDAHMRGLKFHQNQLMLVHVYYMLKTMCYLCICRKFLTPSGTYLVSQEITFPTTPSQS